MWIIWCKHDMMLVKSAFKVLNPRGDLNTSYWEMFFMDHYLVQLGFINMSLQPERIIKCLIGALNLK